MSNFWLNKIKKAILLSKTAAGRIALKRMAMEKVLNAAVPLTGILNGWSFWKPVIIGIEPTNRCNINCIMCGRRYWDKESNPLGDMPIELFREKILPFLYPQQRIVLQGFGEPLLGKSFFEMLKECKDKECYVQFNTNGLLLKKYARRFVEMSVDTVIISIDGIKSFSEIRGIKLDSIIDGVRELNSVKYELKKSNPSIQFEFVAMEKNVSELLDLVDMAYSLRVGSILVVHAVIHSKKLTDQSLFNHSEEAQTYFKEALLRAEKKGINIHLPPLTDTVKFCEQPFQLLFVNWNGEVRPCCSAMINEKNTLKLGSVKNSSLKSLWNSRQMRQLRMALLGRGDMPTFCRRCPMRNISLESHVRILPKG